MKQKAMTLLTTAGLLCGSALFAGAAETAAERLERGVQVQEIDGDLDAAIKEYTAVLRLDEKSKKLAAEARYRLAECYVAKGNFNTARGHVERLRKDFPADDRWVTKATTLFPIETAFSGTPWPDGRSYLYEVSLKSGEKLGTFILAQRKVEDDRGTAWESSWIRAAGNYTLSRSRFLEEGYQPLETRWYFRNMGDVTTKFEKGGPVRLFNAETGEETDTYDHATSSRKQTPLFENEQMAQLIRTLNLKIGTKQDTVLIAAFNGAVPIEFNMEVTAHQEVETPAGTFDCAKIETNLKQTFFISRGKERQIVKLDMGVARVNLMAEDEWDGETARELSSEHHGCAFKIPGPMIAMPPVDNGEVYRIQLWSTDFAGRDGLLEVNLTKNLVEDARKSARAYALKILEGAAKNLDEWAPVNDSWEEITVGGVKGVALRTKGLMGEIPIHEFQVYVLNGEKALSFRFNHAGPEGEEARSRVLEILKSFRWEK